MSKAQSLIDELNIEEQRFFTGDDLLAGFTYDDLIETVNSNEKMHDKKAVMKVFKELMKIAVKDAEYAIKADMDKILAELS